MPQVGFQARPCSPPAGPIRPGHLSHRTDAGFNPASQPIPVRNRYAVSTRPGVRTFTGYSTTRVSRHFLRGPVSLPHTSRFLFNKNEQGLKIPVYSAGAGLPGTLALAPCMRLSPHTAPMQKFRSHGGTSAWAWQPRRVARRAESNGYVGWRPDR